MYIPSPLLFLTATLSVAAASRSEMISRTEPIIWGNGYIYSSNDCTGTNETIEFASGFCFPLALGPRESFQFLPPSIYEFPAGCVISAYEGSACNGSLVLEIAEEGEADECWVTGMDGGEVEEMNSLFFDCSALGK